MMPVVLRTSRLAAVAAALLLTTVLGTRAPIVTHAQSPPGATPSSRQIRWHALEMYAFLHFSPNTFTDREWGYGDESPTIFNPSAFDADAIVTALKRGGMAGVILTAKHHDGFCLWQTKTTKHSVAASPWRDGKGDVVREIADACRRHGLQFGVYLSPWDRNHPAYGTPAYIDVYRAQLRELLTGYGPIFEVWHDGANGGDGYYGGAREKRTIDRRTYYDWPATWALVRKLQPDAVIFSDVGPDVRWVGNEKGIAPETSWATFAPVGEDGGLAAPGYVKTDESGTGHRTAIQWLPAECDVSIRPGWFWHEKENTRVKTPGQLMDLYVQSVGRGCNLLLNVPPDRRGLLHQADVASLAEFGDRLRRTFGTDLARSATATSPSGGSPAALLDGQRATYWLAQSAEPAAVVIELATPAVIGIVRLREHVALGQRVDAFAIDYWSVDGWREAARGTSNGPTRLLRLATPIETSRVRLRVTKVSAPAALSELGLFEHRREVH